MWLDVVFFIFILLQITGFCGFDMLVKFWKTLGSISSNNFSVQFSFFSSFNFLFHVYLTAWCLFLRYWDSSSPIPSPNLGFGLVDSVILSSSSQIFCCPNCYKFHSIIKSFFFSDIVFFSSRMSFTFFKDFPSYSWNLPSLHSLYLPFPIDVLTYLYLKKNNTEPILFLLG